jgi:hypothetical protein
VDGSLPPRPSPSPQAPTHAFLSAAFSPFSSAGPFVSGSAYVLFIPLLSLLLLPPFFFWFVVVLVKLKIKKRTGRYALSSLGISFLLPSRHLPPVSSASRACGTPPHAAVLLLRRAVLRRCSLFCRLEWPRARRSIRIGRYHRGRMAGYTPKSKDRLAFF